MFDLRVYYNNVPRLCTPGYSPLTHSRLLSPIIVFVTTTCPAYAHIATLAAVFCARHFVRVHVHRAWVLSVLSAVYQLSGIQLSGSGILLSGHSGMQLV